MDRHRVWRIAAVAAAALLAAACASDKGARKAAPEKPAEPKVGALTIEQMDEVQEAVRVGTPAMVRCYEDEVRRTGKRKLVADLVIRIRIAPGGVADRVEITQSNIDSPQMKACLVDVVKSWEFPKVEAPAWFTFPFRFDPAW